MLKKDENKHYIGYHKAAVGVCSDNEQKKYLDKNCDAVHDDLDKIYGDIERGNEVVVVMNEIILGSNKQIFKAMNKLCGLGAELYSVVDDKLYDCCNNNNIEDAMSARDKRKNTLLSERTGSSRGGRPPMDVDVKKEIFALSKSGSLYSKLMDDYDISRATVGRIVKQGRKEKWGDNTVANQKKGKK